MSLPAFTRPPKANNKASSSFSTCFTIPEVHSRYIRCSGCSYRFFVPVTDKSLLVGNNIPLLLPCGHPICSRCVQRNTIFCSSCNETLENSGIEKLPVNLYILGLIIASSKRPIENDDQDFIFCDKSAQRLFQIKSQEFCHECESFASVKCMQCMALFCSSCYSKIHRRALQNHTQILLVKEKNDISCTITNNCSPMCLEVLSYFCNDCDITACANCMLCKHKMHNYITLQEKNEDMMIEFSEVSHKIAENLQRVIQTKQKLKSTLMLANEPETCNDVETKITKHFTRLHGVLQNIQAKLLDQLHHPRNSMKNDLKEISLQLQKQEEQLSAALRLASYTKENFNKVDMRNTIKVLNEMADVPCHLVRNNCTQDEGILFDNDEEMLIKFLENHHTLQISQMPRYELLRTEKLPESHEIESLVEDPSVISMLNQTLSSKTIKSSNVSVTSNESTIMMEVAEPEKMSKDNITSQQVEVIHMTSPSSFYVHYLSSKAKYAQLEKDLRAYAETFEEEIERSPVKFHKNSICIVKQVEIDNWYRGRVMNVNSKPSDSFEMTYNIFYIDYGYKEYHVPISRVRSIRSSHLELPSQAIRCCLHGIVPIKKTWTQKSIKDFSKLLQENSIFMYVMEQAVNIMRVDICIISSKDNSMGPQSICNAMIYMKHACKIQMCPSVNTNSTNIYTKEELVLNKKTFVTISHIESPAEIYVVKKEKCSDNLLKLLDDLKEYYENNASKHIISTPEKGLLCVAQHTDNFWHRCKIIEVISKDRVKVFFVDKGYTLTLSCDVLRTIPDKYTELKAQAIRISLRYVSSDPDETWKTESVDTLSGILNCESFVCVTARQKTKDGYSCCISLNGEDVSRLLKSKGVVSAWKCKPSKKVQHNIDTTELLDNIPKELLKDSESDTKSVEEEKDPFKMEVCIKWVVAPDCIYIALKDREELNASLINAMQEFYNNYCSESQNNWSENALCAVYSTKDKAYFRALVKEIKSPMEIIVYFCDMGIIEVVTMKDIQVLHQQFAKQPAHCFKVKLAGILPCGGSSTWPSLSISKLTDIIRENSRCKFFITNFDQEDSCKDTIPVELWVRQMKVPGPLLPVKIEVNCINKMLVDEGVVLPIKNYFNKTIAIRAAKFKQQLLSKQLISCDEKDVQWFDKETCRKVNCKIDDLLSSHENDLSDQACSVDTSKDQPKEATDWLPPDEIEEEIFYAIATNLDYKGFLYLHPIKNNSDVIKSIETELETYVASKKIKKFEKWKEGDICIAKYHKNQMWYRGKVLQVLQQVDDKVTLQILFVDYGNEEECELEDVIRAVKMDHIPIQCTKCVIDGLSPETVFGNWTRLDLDRVHGILVDHKIEVTVMHREPTHLVVSVVLVEHNCEELLKVLAIKKSELDMKIKIKPRTWNNSITYEEEDSILYSSITEKITDNAAADTSKKSSLELEKSDIMLKENVISGSFVEVAEPAYNNIKEIVDFETISDISPVDDCVISSTPQNLTPPEGSLLSEYKPLNIPPDTKYIEMILCCNKNSTTSYAHLAENNDDMFSDVLHNYYMQYENIMSDIQENASSQPLIESFENNTPCIAKFTDDRWYRCSIMQNELASNTQFMNVTLRYIDYGNDECRMLDLSTKNHDLHVLKKEWIELPTMTIKCQFWNIDVISDDNDLLALKLDEIYNKVVVARVKEIKENKLVAEIYKDKMCQELLYADLIDAGLYRYKKPKED